MSNIWDTAFPVVSELIGHNGGMLLRDYFAAKAMQGLLAADYNSKMQNLAIDAYQIADEMLKVRSNVVE